MNELDLEPIKKRLEGTTEGPWFYSGYSGIFSAPLSPGYDAWMGPLVDAEHTLERRGPCPPCGENAGCIWFKVDYEEKDPLIGSVPAAFGDTAVGRRAKDAEFMAEARKDIPALIAEVERLRAWIEDHSDGES